MSDVQPAADLAICRTCGVTHRLSELVGENELAEVDLDEKPGHVTLVNGTDGLSVVYRRLHGSFWFLLPFTCLWGGGSIWGIYIRPLVESGRMEAGNVLFGVPFLLGTLALLTGLVYLIFGYREIRIRPEGADHGEISVFAGVGRIGTTKRIRYRNAEIRVLLECGNCAQNGQPLEDICIRNDDDEEIRFGAFLPKPDKRYIAALIRAAISGS
ncbi:MAG: hypothetical protein Q4C47_05110 [Planctomycetia bacterium]|nr:hypothetical protein [Planctomycetia bacterium]